MLYSDFSEFTRDQEYLISLKMHGQKFDYVEGFVIVDEGLINNWRSSFFSPRNPLKITSLAAHSNGGVLYCLEITKNYHDGDSIDQVLASFYPSKSFFFFKYIFLLINKCMMLEEDRISHNIIG